MRLINVCHLSALPAVLASVIVITSTAPRTPLLTRRGDDLEVEQQQLSLAPDGTVAPHPLVKRVDINDLVSKEIGQGWTMHVVNYYALVPVDSAALALESYEQAPERSSSCHSRSFTDRPCSRFYSNIRTQASAMTQQSAAASLPHRLDGKAGNLFTANSAFF